MYEIELKPLTSENATTEYVEWLNNNEINQYLESRYTKHTIESIEKFISESNESLHEHLFGIFCKKTGKHVGNIKLGPVNIIYKRAEVGLLIGDKDYWGKGIATQAIQIICDYATNELNLHKVEAGCYSDNVGSLKAFEKVGFIVEGKIKHHFKKGSKWCDAYRLGKILNT
jgi:RimJ/RimL family protein N-acetyltransferase